MSSLYLLNAEGTSFYKIGITKKKILKKEFQTFRLDVLIN